jgi:predicted alpha/beta-hydrolase family hydrolase
VTREFIHRPVRAAEHGIALTHGAGSNCDSHLLVALSAALVDAGFLVLRYDLPFRQTRPTGPPRPGDAAMNRQGIIAKLNKLRAMVPGRILAGGHSYGGRQNSMAAAENPKLADGLLLLSYPLHAPRRPTELRTAHFSTLNTPCLFVHGTRDPFGSPDELSSALKLIPAHTDLYLLDGAGHDLNKPAGTGFLIAGRVLKFVAAL